MISSDTPSFSLGTLEEKSYRQSWKMIGKMSSAILQQNATEALSERFCGPYLETAKTGRTAAKGFHCLIAAPFIGGPTKGEM
jgi:hypothetical protein